MAKAQRKVWADLKVGDRALEVYVSGAHSTSTPILCTVEIIGSKWITTSRGNRYNRDTGYGEQLNYMIHTKESLVERRRRCEIIERVIFLLSYGADRIPSETLDLVDGLLLRYQPGRGVHHG